MQKRPEISSVYQEDYLRPFVIWTDPAFDALEKIKNTENKFKYSGTAKLSINLGDLLELEDSNLVTNAVLALDKMGKTNNADQSLSSSHRILITVKSLGNAVFSPIEPKTYNHTIGFVNSEIKDEGKTAEISLWFNDSYKVNNLLNAIKGRSFNSIPIELSYTGTFDRVNYQNPVDEQTMTVSVKQGNLFTLSDGSNSNMKFVIRQNGNDPKIDLLKNSSISVEPDEPVKPQKPSGTLTGGYPSSKPGSSNSSSVVRPMHRLYNPKTGEHFYTQSAEERDNLVRGGWNNEGIGWHAPAGSSTPVYRVFNPNSGDHHYTTNLEEYQTLTRIGWNAEGIGWYSESDKGAPIYRLYNKKIKVGSHHYTQNPAERDKLVNEGWVYEGIAWYAMK